MIYKVFYLDWGYLANDISLNDLLLKHLVACCMSWCLGNYRAEHEPTLKAKRTWMGVNVPGMTEIIGSIRKRKG